MAAFGYVLLAGFAVPAQRTLYMLTVAAIGLWLARPGTAAVVWLWALAVVLAYDPWASLDAGILAVVRRRGAAALHRRRTHRPRPRRRWRAAVRAQAAITLGLIPLMLALFQQVSIVSPLANAVAIPVVTFIVVPLTLASIALPWDGLLVIAHQVFAWLALLLECLSGLPAAVWQQHAPPLWTALAGAIGVLWLLAPRGVPGRVLGLAWLAPLFVVVPPPPAPGAFRVTVLDVGQGLAVLVQTHAHALLYDTGPRYNDTADAGNRIIAPMLRATGIRALDALVVSHQDSDHSGGALSLLQTVPVGWLASSLPEQNAIVGAQRGARRGGARAVSRDSAGTGTACDSRRSIRSTRPISSRGSRPMTCRAWSASSRRRRQRASDRRHRGARRARAVARDAAALRSDLLIVPHHGSRTSSTPAFIAAVRRSRRVHARLSQSLRTPAARIVARYAAAGIRDLRTDYDGALIFTFRADVVALSRALERERERRYWRDPPVRRAAAAAATERRGRRPSATVAASARIPPEAPVDGTARRPLPALCERFRDRLASRGLYAAARDRAPAAAGVIAGDRGRALELKLSTALGPAYAQGKAGERWAALIRERSAGRFAVRHYPARRWSSAMHRANSPRCAKASPISPSARRSPGRLMSPSSI